MPASKSVPTFEVEDRRKHPDLYLPEQTCPVCREETRDSGHFCLGCGVHVWDGKNGRCYHSDKYDGWVAECWKCWRERNPKPE